MSLSALLCRKEEGTWSNTADGLLGLAYSNLFCSPTCYSTVLDDLYSSLSSQGFRNQFSLCLSEEKGILSLGDIDTALYAGDIYWVDIQNPSYYSVRLTGIKMDSVVVTSVMFHAIVHL